MAKTRRRARRSPSRAPARTYRAPSRRRSYSGNTRRAASRGRATARQQTVRVVIEQATPYTGNMALPQTLPTIPGSAVVVGRKRKF